MPSLSGRGICLASRLERGATCTVLRILCHTRHSLGLLEVHGTEGEALHAMQQLSPSWRVINSVMRSPDGIQCPGAGGVATAVCLRLHETAKFVNNVVVPGRCMGTSLYYRDSVVTVLNIHKYGFTILFRFTALGISCLPPSKM